MNIIAAADINWGIGRNGGLLEHIPEDMKFFREMTTNKVVIMGRKTFLSLPKQRPLPERVNIVLSRDSAFCRDGILVCSDLRAAMETARQYAQSEKIFFIGGESVYRAAEPYCDTAYITRILKAYDADVFLQDFDRLPHWASAQERALTTAKGLQLIFRTYRRTDSTRN